MVHIQWVHFLMFLHVFFLKRKSLIYTYKFTTIININIKISVKSLNFCNFIKTKILAYSWSIGNIGRFVNLSSLRVDWKICFFNLSLKFFFHMRQPTFYGQLYIALIIVLILNLVEIHKNSISQEF